MSSKPKALLKQSKSKNRKEQTLDTADDYQAAGVDFEDAAGKWRAGDATKSMRFFNRALEVYEQGLQRFPQSFDLAYNKARVQLEIATHPVLVRQLQQPIWTVLQAALESHRYALLLNQENPDVLFNTSQVLTSIAEEIAKSDTYDDTDAVRCLEEALELQNRCFSLQELKYEEGVGRQEPETTQEIGSSAETVDDDEEDGGASIGTSKEQEEQWFSIVEPVTQDTLIETALAQLNTLTTLCGVLSSSPAVVPPTMLAWIEDYSTRILSKKLPYLVKDNPDRLPEIALCKGNFVSALLEAGYRGGTLDVATYKRERDEVFAVPELNLEKSVEALVANARSLMSFGTALADSAAEDSANSPTVRWNAFSAAITNLVTAAKVPGIATDDLSKTHLLRGDCSMLQHRMSLAPTFYQSAIANGSQLLKNAEIFYKNASKLSPDSEDKAVADFRSAIVRYIQQGDRSSLVTASRGRNESWAGGQLEDMVLEGLVPSDFRIQ